MASNQNTLDAIPALKPDREDIASRRGGGGGGGKKPAPKQRKESSGGWLLVLLCLAAVAALGAWSYLLNQQLQEARQQLLDTSGRLQVLEQKLSITDESMSQSSVALQVKLQDMDKEIRKLWDNVWKRAKQDLAQHDKDIKALKTQVENQGNANSEVVASVSQVNLAIEVLEDQLESTGELTAVLDVLQAQVATQEEALQEMRSTAKALSATNADLKKRVAGTEEWVDSFNGYRTQMNRKLLDLQSTVGSLQAQ